VAAGWLLKPDPAAMDPLAGRGWFCPSAATRAGLPPDMAKLLEPTAMTGTAVKLPEGFAPEEAARLPEAARITAGLLIAFAACGGELKHTAGTAGWGVSASSGANDDGYLRLSSSVANEVEADPSGVDDAPMPMAGSIGLGAA